MLWKFLKKSIRVLQKGKKPKEPKKPPVGETEEEEIEPPDHRTNLLNLIKSLPPSGFERLSQRLLRESGFQKVEVTGKTGDGGIDGVGILQVNPFRELQCSFPMQTLSGSGNPFPDKRFPRGHDGKSRQGHHHYHRHIHPRSQERGRRDGAPPIELVDGDTLVQMFEQQQLGLIPRTTYDVDEKFFDDFRK